MSPQFTIIVPVYNTEKYLKKCMASLLEQTLKNIEVILIDDGSTDNSGKICDSFLADERVRVIHKENEGQGIARNAGLEQARGEYILFIDSDDSIERDTCDRLFSYMKENQVQLCSFGYLIEDGSGKEVYRPKLKEKIYRGDQIKGEFVHHFFGDSLDKDELRGVSACMSVFQRELIERFHIRFPSERKVLSEDTLFNLEYCKHIESAAVLPEYFYHYLQNETSFSHAYRPDRYSLTERLCSLLEEYALEYGISHEVQGRIQMVMWVSLMECLKQEVKRKDIGKKQLYGNVRALCKEPGVQKAVWILQPSGFAMKQRILLIAVRYKWTLAAMFLAILRNRRGL